MSCNTQEMYMILHPTDLVQVNVTAFFSHKMPNLTMVILAMDYIDEAFTNSMLNDQDLSPAIHVAIGLAKKTLNRYYSLTDSADVYCIAMGMSIDNCNINLIPSHSFAPLPQA